MELTAVITHPEEGGFVALNPETGTTTQGETVGEAVTNLKEATALYLSEFPLFATAPKLERQPTGMVGAEPPPLQSSRAGIEVSCENRLVD